jgi:hypothetical protein
MVPIPVTAKARPMRTSNSLVWGGVAAWNMRSNRPVFQWNAVQTEMFKKFLRENWPNARNSADWTPLLVALDLDGHDKVKTDEGVKVAELIRQKVKSKLYNEEKKMSTACYKFGR